MKILVFLLLSKAFSAPTQQPAIAALQKMMEDFYQEKRCKDSPLAKECISKIKEEEIPNTISDITMSNIAMSNITISNSPGSAPLDPSPVRLDDISVPSRPTESTETVKPTESKTVKPTESTETVKPTESNRRTEFNQSSSGEEQDSRQNWWIEHEDGSEDVAEDEDTPCGTLPPAKSSKDDGMRIIGGRKAKENSHPWIARLVRGCAAGLCAGALISRRHVLTAYHCTFNKNDKTWNPLKGPCDHSDRKRLAIFGLHTFNLDKISEYEKTGKSDSFIVPVIDIKTPRNYLLRREPDESHDFAMAILEREITFTDSVRPICIPRQDMEFGGTKAIAAGWGRYTVGKKGRGKKGTTSNMQSLNLMEVELRVSKKRYNHYQMFGTKVRNKKGEVADPCSGDSGGPLIWKSRAPRFVLIGTVQGSGFNCITGHYTMFEGSDNGVWNKVSAHSDWIKKAMKDEHQNGHNSSDVSEEAEIERAAGFIAGEVEMEDDYIKAKREYKKDLENNMFEELEKEAKKMKRKRKEGETEGEFIRSLAEEAALKKIKKKAAAKKIKKKAALKKIKKKAALKKIKKKAALKKIKRDLRRKLFEEVNRKITKIRRQEKAKEAAKKERKDSLKEKGVIMGEVEMEDDYFKAKREYKKDLENNEFEDLEKEAKKMKRKRKKDETEAEFYRNLAEELALKETKNKENKKKKKKDDKMKKEI